jgi:hypothetical protein
MRASGPTTRHCVGIQGKPVKKLGSGSRATFVSPYLRRPLRPLDKVLSERDEAESPGAGLVAGEAADEPAPGWRNPRKRAAAAE